MAATRVGARDRDRFARARARGEARAQDPSAVVDARYHAAQDTRLSPLSRWWIDDDPQGDPSGAEGRVSAGTAIDHRFPGRRRVSWPSLDVDVYVPGLVERAFGTRLFARATGQRGGRRRSKAKAEAARANGAKGGRPRKRLSG